MSRLREMALDVTPDSLVLLDEIGSATDPEEGGALGVALVDHFRAAGAFTIASTHLTALKIYGARTKTVLNASMGFDEQTLDPTYQLQGGAAGQVGGAGDRRAAGHARGYSQTRAGVAEHAGCRAYPELIADLHRRLEESVRLKEELERERVTIAARERQNALDAERREAAKLRELEGRFDEMELRWRERADETLAKIAETADRRKAVDEAQRQTSKVRREMREDWEAILPSSSMAEGPKRLAIAEGVRVRVKGIREPARVRRDLGNGRFEVEAGFMKVQVAAGDIEEVLPESNAPGVSKLPKNVRFQAGPALNPMVQEINVIGEHAEEAIDPSARSRVDEPPVTPRSEVIFDWIVDWYCGRSPASRVSWVAIRLPRAKITTKASSTVATAASTRGTRRLCRRLTGAASTKLRRMASATGTKISRPTYSAATMMPASTVTAQAPTRPATSSSDWAFLNLMLILRASACAERSRL